MSVANWTTSQVLAQLDSGYHWSGTTISYAFPLTASGMYSEGEATSFRPIGESQKALFTLALQNWDNLIPRTFQLSTLTSSNIEMGYTSSNIDYAHAYYPTNGSAWFRTGSDVATASVGSYGFLTIMHELGHALGLNHMGGYNGAGSWLPSSYQDTKVLSIMSYFGPDGGLRSSDVMWADWTATDGDTYSPQTPMLNDVLAIQSMYGISTTTNTGNTTYGFNATVSGSAASVFDFSINRNPILTIFDSGGLDTLDLSGWSTPSSIYLESGVYSSCDGMTNNLVIAYSATLENAIGGGGNDSLTGNASANQLYGGSGNDQLDGAAGDDTLVGGAGTDTAVFAGAFSSYAISFDASTGTFAVAGAVSGTDMVSEVENFQFGDGLKTSSQLQVNDTQAPTLTNMSPADNATGVLPSASLVLSFSESVKAGAGNFVINNADGSVARTIAATDTSQVSFVGNVVTLNPNADLLPASSYYLTMAAGVITDLAGNNFAGISNVSTYSFSTAESSATDDYLWSSNTDGVVTIDGAASSGRINFVDDADAFKVALTAGISYRFKLVSKGLSDPYLQLYGPEEDLLYFDDDSAGGLDAEIIYTATASGTYFLGAMDQATGLGNYLLSAETLTSSDDHPWSTATAGVVRVNATATSGTIETVNDADLFAVTLVAGHSYVFDLARATGGLSDPYLMLYSPQIDLLSFDDDSAGAQNSRISFTATSSGIYYLGAMDYASGTGAYLLSATAAVVAGTSGDDTLYGTAGNNTLDGGAGIDTAIFSGSLAGYTISKSGSSYTVQDNVGTDGTDTLSHVESLKFADKTVNLTIQAKAAAAPLADVQGLTELYVAFFNRVPDADGLEYWIGQLGAGASINQIAEVFYSAGIQYASLTGFSASMSNTDFINVVYKNVLGRSDGADADGLDYWNAEISSGRASHGSLVSQILSSAHSFKGHATWGWVADLLDNKIAVASTFAITWGLNYNTPDESIAQGMAVAAAVSPGSTLAAITLIGVSAADLMLV